MSRHNYDLYNNSQLGRALDTWVPNRRRFGFYAEPTLTGFTPYGIGGTDIATSLATNQVTQATNKSTAVTLNTFGGLITLEATDSIAAGAEVSFTVNNSLVGANETVLVNHVSGGTAGAYLVQANTSAAGSFKITVSNLTAGPLAEGIVLSFRLSTPLLRVLPVVGSGSASNGDAAGGSFVAAITGAAGAGNSTKVLTATAVTRRAWDPWIRFRFVAGTVAQMADTRIWIGAFSADPSAVAGEDLGVGGALSGAGFGWDTGVDAGTVAGTAADAFWRTETAEATASEAKVTDVPIIALGMYTGEIRFDSTNAKVDFYLAYNGLSTSAYQPAKLNLVASHGITVPAASTTLLLGATVTTLTNAAKRVLLGSIEGSQY